MKQLLFSVIVVVMCISLALGQEKKEDQEMQTLINFKKVTFGGYGGPEIGFSKIDNRDVVLVGGHGGVVINHFLVIGGSGCGIVNQLKYDNIGGTNSAYLLAGYGGLYMNLIIKPLKIIHFSVPMVIGAGGIQYVKDINHQITETNIIDQDAFLVFEPGLDIELNVLRFMRLGAGVKYRWAPNIDLIDTPNDPFNGITYGISLKFGKF